MNLTNYAKPLVRAYVFVLVAGVLTGAITSLNFKFPSDGIASTIAWPLGGILSGLLYFGLGPILVLYFIGIQNGAAVGAYLKSGGGLFMGEKTIGSLYAASILEISHTAIESLAFLYGAVGGMYLGIYYFGIFETGSPQDETPKKNFIRKAAESFVLTAIAIGLQLISL